MNSVSGPPISVILPAFNEEAAIGPTIERIIGVLRRNGIEHEILVVDDGSSDGTARIAQARGARVVAHPQNLGYGRSLKTGISSAAHDLVAIIDADGTYPVERLPDLIDRAKHFDMVVGARTGGEYLGSFSKRLARQLFKALSEFTAGRTIPDINSGFRVFRRSDVCPFFPSISSGFSFTTTATLAYMLNDYFVDYMPVEYHKRAGQSKVRMFRDTLRASQIIVETILRYNPIKVFLLLAIPFALASLLSAVVAVVAGSLAAVLIAGIMASTSAIVLAIGFLTSSMQQRDFRKERFRPRSMDGVDHGALTAVPGPPAAGVGPQPSRPGPEPTYVATDDWPSLSERA